MSFFGRAVAWNPVKGEDVPLLKVLFIYDRRLGKNKRHF